MGKRNYTYHGFFFGSTHTFVQYKRLVPHRKAYKKARFKKALSRFNTPINT